MDQIFTILELILEGFLGSINSLVGTLLATEIFEIPLIIFLAFFDFLTSLIIEIFGE